jgi:lysophospholipase L1-like esterase
MSADQRRLLIVGDSMTLGITELRGNEIVSTTSPTYVDLLRDFFKDWEIQVNASIHRRTAEVLPLLDNLLTANKPDRVIFALGGNDADLDWKRFIVSQGRVVRTQVSVEMLRGNLLKLIEMARAHHVDPMLTCFVSHNLPIRSEYLTQLSGMDVRGWVIQGGGEVVSERMLQEYWQMIENLAAEQQIVVVRHGPMLRTFDAKIVLAPDGTHPSAAGHRMIAQAMIAALTSSKPEIDILAAG